LALQSDSPIIRIRFKVKVRRGSSDYQFFKGEAKLIRAIGGIPVDGVDLGNDIWQLETRVTSDDRASTLADHLRRALTNDLGEVIGEERVVVMVPPLPDIPTLEKERDVEGLIKGAAALRVRKHLFGRCLPDRGREAQGLFSKTIDAFVRIGEPAFESLIQALKSRDGDARFSASVALGAMKDPRAIGTLTEALRDEDELVRLSAAQSLCRMGDARAVGPLIRAMVAPVDPRFLDCKKGWLMASWTEWELREPGVCDTSTAAGAFIRIGEPAVGPLIQALNGELSSKEHTMNQRLAVVYALGEIGSPRAVEPLVGILEDRGEHDYVRIRAAEALTKIGGATAVELLTQASEDGDEDVRRRAGTTLEGIRRRSEISEAAKYLLMKWSVGTTLGEDEVRDLLLAYCRKARKDQELERPLPYLTSLVLDMLMKEGHIQIANLSQPWRYKRTK